METPKRRLHLQGLGLYPQAQEGQLKLLKQGQRARGPSIFFLAELRNRVSAEVEEDVSLSRFREDAKEEVTTSQSSMVLFGFFNASVHALMA